MLKALKLWFGNNYKWLVAVISTGSLLSLLFIQNLDANCSASWSKKLFDFCSVVFANGVIPFMQHFNWAFLLLLLFCIPGFYTKVKELVDKISEGAERFSKARVSIPTNQTAEDKKERETEKKEDLGENASQRVHQRYQDLIEKRKGLELQAVKFIENHDRNYTEIRRETKLVIDNDPISDIDKLLFDISYRNGRRTYIHSLFITMPRPALTTATLDRFYRYIRIIKDLKRKYILTALEIVFLGDETMEKEVDENFWSTSNIFSKAIGEGILALREIIVDKDGKIKEAKEMGWVIN